MLLPIVSTMSLQSTKILTVTSAYPIHKDGNHATFLREVMVRMQGTGAEFSVFAPAYEGLKSHTLDGIRVHRFRYCIKRFENLARDGAPTKLQRQPWYLAIAALYILLGSLQLFWVCLKKRPHLLHVHWPFPHGLMALPAHLLFDIPMVFSFHGAELMLMNKFGFVEGLLRWLTPFAAAVTVNSDFTQRLLKRVYEGTSYRIPYGLTIEVKPPKPRPEGTPPRLLFVGRLDERKGLKYLLQAMPLILAERSVDLRVVGRGLLEADLHQQCQALGLAASVQFLGFVSKAQLANEYAGCDVFILPAIVDSKGDTEGLGIVMIEALAHQKPVIASAVGGITDVITSGQTGVLVPQRNSRALATAVLKLLDHPNYAQQLGAQGLQDIQTRFSWDTILPRWQQVFEQAIEPASQSFKPRFEP